MTNVRLRSRREYGPRVAAFTLGVLAVVALAAPWISPYDPTKPGNAVTDRLQPPSAMHLLGTDAASRDVLSRLMHGTSVSLGTAVLAVLVVLVVGVGWGGIAGVAPAWVDRWMMRFVDTVLATPRLLIVLALVAFTERVSAPVLALLLGLTGWPSMSRVVRARVRDLAITDYVVAARALGTSTPRILVSHILPATVPTVLAGVVMAIASVIPLEAALSFVGAGIAPPTASWGTLLQDASARPLDAWWLLLFPSLAIAATVLSVNVIGEQLQRRATGRARA